MMNPEICMIAAMDENRGIGKDNGIPWGLIPDDMKRFKKLTVGMSVIMGRKTFESILNISGRPLPRRHNFVITKDPTFKYEGVDVCHSPNEALGLAAQFEEWRISIIGGAQIYQEFMGSVDKLYLTLLGNQFDCDAFFPEYRHIYNTILSEKLGNHNGLNYKFLELAPGK